MYRLGDFQKIFKLKITLGRIEIRYLSKIFLQQVKRSVSVLNPLLLAVGMCLFDSFF